MQRRKHISKYADLEKDGKWYLDYFNRTDIFQSDMDALNERLEPERALSPEMYQYLVEESMVQARMFQSCVCNNATSGLDEKLNPLSDAQKQYRLDNIKNWELMSPDEFWIMMM